MNTKKKLIEAAIIKSYLKNIIKGYLHHKTIFCNRVVLDVF